MEKSNSCVKRAGVDGFLNYLPHVFADDFCDMMVTCSDHSVMAHQIVLASASPHLRDLLLPIQKEDPNVVPNLIFAETSQSEISQFLNFVYGRTPLVKTEDVFTNSLFDLFQLGSETLGKPIKLEEEGEALLEKPKKLEEHPLVLELMVPGMPMEVWPDLEQAEPSIPQGLLPEARFNNDVLKNLENDTLKNLENDTPALSEKVPESDSSVYFYTKKLTDPSEITLESILDYHPFSKSKDSFLQGSEPESIIVEAKKNNFINEEHFLINNQIEVQEKCMELLAPDGDGRFVCCKKLFGHLDEFRGHQRRHHNFPLINCPYKDKGCPQKGFILKQNVIVHAFLCSFRPNKLLETGANQNQCPFCAVNLSNRQALKSHMLTHVSQKDQHGGETASIVLCPVCGKHFKQHYLPCHIREVHHKLESSRYQCKDCNRLFVRKEKYEGHLTMFHGAPKRYMCNICGKQFAMDSDLCKHRAQVHTLKAELPCGTCGKKFITGERLRRHELTHSGVKPWTCQVCAKSYPRKDKLNAHIKKKHPEADLNTIPSVQVYKEMKIKSNIQNKSTEFLDRIVN